MLYLASILCIVFGMMFLLSAFILPFGSIGFFEVFGISAALIVIGFLALRWFNKHFEFRWPT